jgi:hypothetical protein
MTKKEYLGDSVYAEYDKQYNQIILTTENGLPDDPSNIIYLEYEVFLSLYNFVLKISSEIDKHKNEVGKDQ